MIWYKKDIVSEDPQIRHHQDHMFGSAVKLRPRVRHVFQAAKC